MKTSITLVWFKNDLVSEPEEEHKDSLLEEGLLRAYEMIKEGFICGQLLTSREIPSQGDENESIHYDGRWEIHAEPEPDMAGKEVPASCSLDQEWELLPKDLRTHLGDWLQACQLASDGSPDADDRAYWRHQVNVLNTIGSKLVDPRDVLVVTWHDVANGLPEIPEGHMTDNKVYVVRSGGVNKFATLMAGQYLGDDRWACDGTNLALRRWVEIGSGATCDRFLTDVTHWADV